MLLSASDLIQRDAADGTKSVWVAASAGTGKTTVLTNRVLNLLLAGTAPERILCLTFTKAAAAEMANRLNTRLSKWAIAGDKELRDDIERIVDPKMKGAGDRLDRARRLFARVLDTPGGMRILTIHAFCQSILRRFPLEARIPPQFEVMDDRSAEELLADVQNQVLARAGRDADLAAAIAEITRHVEETRFAALIKELTGERGRLQRAIDEAGGLEQYLERLAGTLGVPIGETEASCIAAACDSAMLDELGLRGAAAALLGSKAKTDVPRGEILASWLSAGPSERQASFDDYCGAYLTDKGAPRKILATKDIQPLWGPVLETEQARIIEARARRAAAIELAATTALTRLGAAFLAAYGAEKRRRGMLDYDDLILAVRNLMEQPEVTPWVLFKLDGGIEHVLIDEAQDTNPDQWSVAAALTQEFFAGKGASETFRTVFAVGDLKQSIFSFQRADPGHFIDMRQHFRASAERIKEVLHDIPLQTSFRSTKAVLDVVDAVFARPEAADGVALDGAKIVHVAHRTGEAGRVELWPPLDPPEADELQTWPLPVTAHRAEASPRARLARLIAEKVAYWISSGEELASKGRPIRAGDIMVLVRRRKGFVVELVRELKRLNVTVAGADRMVLSEQLAIMDLVALGHFLLLPEDDLTLATVLKGPLIGLDEERLFELSYNRDGRSLWSVLRRHTAPWARQAAEILSGLLARADFVPPHELYAELLGAGHGRRRLLGRLGMEAAEAIDEFLTQALAYERAHVPSLQGFLHWIEIGGTEVKRDLDQSGRDEIRIMTVHGSKGLQAPIVFLPDTMAVPTKLPLLLWHGDRTMLWAPGLAAGERIASAARETAKLKQAQEYRRLLYVALTRAEDRIYVCGWNTKRKASDECWHALVSAGMADVTGGTMSPIVLAPRSIPFGEPGYIYKTAQTAKLKPASPDRLDEASMPSGPLPSFASTPPPPEPLPPRPLVASRASGEEPPVRSPLAGMLDPQRFQRGIVIHRLLQTLPDLPPAEAEPAARRYLAKQSPALESELQARIVREVMAVITDAEFAPLFAPGSRAEVPIVGLIDGHVLSARVDRLVVTADQVLVVDYKTNRPPPLEVAQVSPVYIEQMAIYRKALERIYPGRRVRTLLLWTDGPRLMEIG